MGIKAIPFSTEDCRFKDRIEDDIRSYLGKDTSGFREAGLLLERKTELYEHQEISLAQIEERREKEFVHSSLYYLPQRENPGLWKKIFRNLQPEKSSSGL